MNKTIGLIDSGIGGFSVLKRLQEHFPALNFIYYGDSKNMPYGEKERDEIIALVNKDIRFVENKGVDLIVLACNTASSLIDELNSTVPLLSIIEAGCRAVLRTDPDGPVGLIATRATVGSRAYEKRIKEYSDDIEFISYGTPTLAKTINNQLEEIELLKTNIHQAIAPILKQYPVKNLLLGCTHYPIVSAQIRRLYPEINLIDPALEMIEILDKTLGQTPSGNDGFTDIYINGNKSQLEQSRYLLGELNIDYRTLNLENE